MTSGRPGDQYLLAGKSDEKIKGATSFFLFKVSLLKMGCPHANSTYRTHIPVGVRLLPRLHLGLSHLTEHKFRYNFAVCVNPYAPAVLNLRPHFTSFCTASTS